MIRLINNELNKIKKSKLLFIDILFIILLFVIDYYSEENILDLSFNLIPFLGVVICILFSGSICGEIESGTMRYYLTKPYKRYKVYLSKLIVIILYLLFSISLIIVFSLIINGSINYKYIYEYYIDSIPILFLSSFILFLSIKFKSTVLVSCICVLTLCFSLIVSQVLFGINIKLIEYTFLPYLDFSIFKDKNIVNTINSEYGVNISLIKAIIVDSISFLLFSIYGIYKFNKKDIKS